MQFDLAEQLHIDKFFKQLIIGFQNFAKKIFYTRINRIKIMTLKEILLRSLKKINLVDQYFDIDLITSNLFDYKASKL